MLDLLERLKSALADRYAVNREIGRGGMATVYLAQDPRHDRRVAIKVLHPELAASVGAERFLQEIKTVAGLTHPHVLPLYDSGETDGLLYFVMPYVEGESLRQRLERERQLPIDEAIRITREVADALDHAHRNGVIHRDIKPANILLEEGHAVVADFGVARAVSEAGGEKVTATGMAVGTPAYMSPEQASGEEVDERSDLYALGCVLYEMLAGEPPLTGSTAQSTAAKRLTDRPTPLGAMRRTVPGSLESLVERMLATSAADRPGTARQLTEELAEVGKSPEPAARRSPAARWLVPVIGLAVIAVVVAIVSMLATDRSATRDVRLLPVGADLGDQSIAVLPLANNTGVDSLDWYGPVLTTLLTTGLVQLEAVQVVSAHRLLDLIRQAGHAETERIPEDLALRVAASSGAHTLVYGSFVRLGEDFRLDVQLIDTSNGTVTGAEQERGTDVFTLVDAVTARLSSRVLGETIMPTELTPVAQLTTGSLDALREYQEGLLAERRYLPAVATEHYQRAVELDSTFALAWLRLGVRALNGGNDQLAASHLERADRYSAHASERDRLSIRASLAWISKKHDDAISYLEELVARHPDEKDARYRLSRMYYFQDRPEDSRRMLEEVLGLDPSYSTAVNDLAYMAAHAGDEAAADSLTLRYIELEPDLWNPYDSRAEILTMFGRYEEAREMDRESLRRNPGNPTPYGRLVLSYLRDDDPAGARAELRTFENTGDPHSAMFARWLETDTYVVEGRYRDAFDANRSAAAKANELGHDFAPLILAEAGVYANATGAYEQAENLFREQISLDAQPRLALFGILGTYGGERRFDEMSRVREAAAAAIDTAPDFARARAESLLSFADGLIAWYQAGDAAETVRLFGEGRATLGISKTTALRGLQGEEILALIEVGRASDALEIANEMEGMAEDGWYSLLGHQGWYLQGRAYEALGEPEQALESYQRLLDVAGDGVREVLLFRDTPERVARLRGEP